MKNFSNFFKKENGWVEGKEKENGVGTGFDCNGGPDSFGSNGHGIWIERGMAVDCHCPWDRRPFS
jgi:hypothetical protein